jgi:hypothetical protein
MLKAVMAEDVREPGRVGNRDDENAIALLAT